MMQGARLHDDTRAKKNLPLVLVAFVAYFLLGFWSALFAVLAFLIGRAPSDRILAFVSGIEERRRRGRAPLDRLSGADVARIPSITRDGRKIEAVRELRAINNDGLRDAKDAVELFEDFGLQWRDSQNMPPR